MKQLEAKMSNGDTIRTSFNGTVADAMAYYIGKTFNLGVEDDKLVYGCALVVDGIAYNPSTHKYVSERAHEKNLELIAARIAAREALEGARVGDFIRTWHAGEKGGEYLRFTHDWGESIQTTCLRMGDASQHGGFYSCKQGGTSFSGSLDSGVQKEDLRDTGETRNGLFWMFNEDYASAHNGVSFYMPCRVFEINPMDMPRSHKIRVVYDNGQHAAFERHGTPASVANEFVGRFHYVEGKRRFIEAVRFYDGEQYLTYKKTARLIYSGGHGYAIDHGEKLGLELYSEKHGGSKWFLDARRRQLLAIGNHGHKWSLIIAKEF